MVNIFSVYKSKAKKCSASNVVLKNHPQLKKKEYAITSEEEEEELYVDKFYTPDELFSIHDNTITTLNQYFNNLGNSNINPYLSEKNTWFQKTKWNYIKYIILF